MKKTLQDILVDTSAYLDLTTTIPTGDELLVRANYADRAVREAASVGQLNEFKKVFEVGTGAESRITLPIDFRELQTAPRILLPTGGWSSPYTEIMPEEQYDMDQGSNWCYILGNRSEGYMAVFNNIVANATLSVVYQKYPTGLPTLSSICELSDETYVNARVEAFVLESRDDGRFPLKKAESQQALANMSARGSKTPGGGVNQTPRNFHNPLG
jgi:hypothetical protein